MFMEPPEGSTEQFCDEYIAAMTNFDFSSLTAHVVGNCAKCAELQLKCMAKEYEGQEMLFTDGHVPPWIQREEEERKARMPAEEKQPPTAAPFANKKEPRNKILGPEEIDVKIWEMNLQNGISDASLAYHLRKYKKMSEEEARKEVIALRRRKLEHVKERPEKEGEFTKLAAKEKRKEPQVPRAERCEQKKHLPWAPKLTEYFPQDERSALTDEEHKRIVSILSAYWNESRFRFTENKEDVKSADKRLEEERAKLNQSICQELNPFQLAGSFPTGPLINGYVSNRCSKRWEAAVGMSFHKQPIEVVEWPNEIPETGSTSKTSLLIDTIQLGHSVKIRLPSLEDRLQIQPRDVQKNRPVILANRGRIEEDSTAFTMCLERGIAVAMDATTACYLMTEAFMARRELPKYIVSVRTEIHEGAMKKVIFISKPLHTGSQTSPSYLKTFAKHGFLGQYLEKPARQEIYEEEPTKSLHDIVLGVETTFPTPEEPKSQKALSISGADDPLGQIMTEMGDLESQERRKTSKTGKRYAIYKIGSQNVLIRSTAPMQCQTDKIACLKGKGISLGTVIEWLPNVGAMRLQAEELLFNYCKHVFKGSQAHCLVRVGVAQMGQGNWTNIDVLQIHTLSAFTDPLSAEIDQNMKKMLAHRLDRLDELLGTVSSLEDGFFMLQEAAGKMHICKELDQLGQSQQ